MNERICIMGAAAPADIPTRERCERLQHGSMLPPPPPPPLLPLLL